MINTHKLLWLSIVCAILLVPAAVAKATARAPQPGQQTLNSALDTSGFQLEMTGHQQAFADNRLMYTVSFQNTGYRASDAIDITSPVPPDTVYIANSALGEDCDILFSVDGGASWGQAGQLEVQNTDGEWRTATARDYTHIKWLYLPELRPAEVQQVSFQVVLE